MKFDNYLKESFNNLIVMKEKNFLSRKFMNFTLLLYYLRINLSHFRILLIENLDDTKKTIESS